YYADQFKINPENILVITDDLALPLAKLRIKAKGSDGGHNGLKSINEVLGTTDYPRLRFGIGNNFPKGRQADYVLGRWKSTEEIGRASCRERVEVETTTGAAEHKKERKVGV